ncbi:unnamed protein product [Fusarium venenatum]|uniref:F-box domain-containing protein n=1 Tax=Fusarium venenatum TaxID=56646 RepID=A0A2L2T3U9_9HYPO|nr:uncharacterized protein FVRRES_13594 [Fusarium venenatum]CEI41472.1 unnamed protein product [Fusarium venenatum]
MTGLIDLPNELLEEIFLLATCDDQRQLSRAAVVNKRIQQVAFPLLKWRRISKFEVGSLALHLLRHLYHRPLVRTLVLYTLSTLNVLERNPNDGTRANLRPETLAELAEAAERTMPDLAEFSEGWIDRIDDGIIDVVLALILAWANRLTEVSLSFRGRYETVDNSVVCRSLSRLPQLRTVEIDMGYFLPKPENLGSFESDFFVSMLSGSLTKLVITWQNRYDIRRYSGFNILSPGCDENRTCSLITEAIGMLLQEAGPGYKFSKLRCIDALDINWEPESLENAVELGKSRCVRVIEPISMIRSIL